MQGGLEAIGRRGHEGHHQNGAGEAGPDRGTAVSPGPARWSTWPGQRVCLAASGSTLLRCSYSSGAHHSHPDPAWGGRGLRSSEVPLRP